MDSLSVWLSKSVMEVAKKSGERYPSRTVYTLGARRFLLTYHLRREALMEARRAERKDEA